MNFSDRFDEIKWYLLACIICFFCIPLFAAILPQYAGLVQLVSQYANIAVVDVTSFLCGYRQFRWYYPIIAMLLYALSATIGGLYTIDSVTSSSIYFLLLSYMAAGIGAIIGRLRR